MRRVCAGHWSTKPLPATILARQGLSNLYLWPLETKGFSSQRAANLKQIRLKRGYAPGYAPYIYTYRKPRHEGCKLASMAPCGQARVHIFLPVSPIPCLLCSVRSAVCKLETSDRPEWRTTEQACSKIWRNRPHCSTTFLQNAFVCRWPCREVGSAVRCPGLRSRVCKPQICKTNWFGRFLPMHVCNFLIRHCIYIYMHIHTEN